MRVLERAGEQVELNHKGTQNNKYFFGRLYSKSHPSLQIQHIFYMDLIWSPLD